MKRKKTCLKRYGVDSYSKTKEAREKARNNLMKQGCLQSSRGQENICNLVGGVLNYPFHGFFLDVLYEDWLDIEYNGGGHDLPVKLNQMSKKDFIQREKNRSAAILSKGLKQLIIVCKDDKLPEEKELSNILFELIEQLRKDDLRKIVVDLTQNTLV